MASYLFDGRYFGAIIAYSAKLTGFEDVDEFLRALWKEVTSSKESRADVVVQQDKGKDRATTAG